MIKEDIVEYNIVEEELGLTWIAADEPTRDLDTLLKDLHFLHGAAFVSQLKYITTHGSFTLVKNEIDIYSTGGEHGDDYDNILNAARKAVEHGYRVFILPNPKNTRTPDFIFEKRGNYKTFDLKTITGKASAGTRMMESIGQSNRVLLNINTDYNARLLASDIRTYFEVNAEAIEVLIFKGKKLISIDRNLTLSSLFNKIFRKRYEK